MIISIYEPTQAELTGAEKLSVYSREALHNLISRLAYKRVLLEGQHKNLSYIDAFIFGLDCQLDEEIQRHYRKQIAAYAVDRGYIETADTKSGKRVIVDELDNSQLIDIASRYVVLPTALVEARQRYLGIEFEGARREPDEVFIVATVALNEVVREKDGL